MDIPVVAAQRTGTVEGERKSHSKAGVLMRAAGAQPNGSAADRKRMAPSPSAVEAPFARRAIGALVAGFLAASVMAVVGGGREATTTQPAAAAPADTQAARPITTTAPVSTTAPAHEPETSAPQPAATDAPTTAPSPPTTSAPPLPDAAALAYKGLIAPTSTSGAAVVIGFVNAEGGSPSFPAASFAADATVDELNRSLGGAGGRPVELRRCLIAVAADGARCGQELRADPTVAAVVVGTVPVGDDALLAALAGTKPVFLTNPLTSAQYQAAGAYAFTPGWPGLVRGLARFVADWLHPSGSKVAVLFSDGLAGRTAFGALAAPVLALHGLQAVGVPVADGASAAAVAASVKQAAVTGVGTFLVLVNASMCGVAADALAQVADATIVAADTCVRPPAAAAGGGPVPEGWFVGRVNRALTGTDDVVRATVHGVFANYAAAANVTVPEDDDVTTPVFGTLLTVAKLVDQVGADQVTPQSLREAAARLTAPTWGAFGPSACGDDPALVTLCGSGIGIERYQDATWTTITADGGVERTDDRLAGPR